MMNKFDHLAPAPYTVVDYSYKEYGSACDHCGTFIKHVFTVRGSNGVKFQLGSQHVEQVGGAELSKSAKQVKKHTVQLQEEREHQEWLIKDRKSQVLEAEKREEERKQEKELYDKQYQEAIKILSRKPHPNFYFASKGKTKLDYLKYFEEQYGRDHSRVQSIVYEAIK